MSLVSFMISLTLREGKRTMSQKPVQTEFPVTEASKGFLGRSRDSPNRIPIELIRAKAFCLLAVPSGKVVHKM